MAFAALSDDSVRAAFWIGAVSVTITLALVVRVIMLRISLMQRERRSRKFSERWQPLIMRCIIGDEVEFPKLDPRDELDFLYLWVHYHEVLRGDAKTRLNLILRTVGIEPQLRKLLSKGSLDEKLIAATALGHLGDRQALDGLARLLDHDSPALSVIAARAVVMIAPVTAVHTVIPMIIKRRDWSAARLATMIKESSPVFLEAFLDQVQRDALDHQSYLPRLMHLVEAVHPNRPLPFVRLLLESSDDPELVSACLRLIHDPGDLDLVRNRLADRHLPVLVQVASALGRMGMREDIPRLLTLLNSREWWVRYRAAQALMNLPYFDKRHIKKMIEIQEDHFARDMLQQVLAERAPA